MPPFPWKGLHLEQRTTLAGPLLRLNAILTTYLKLENDGLCGAQSEHPGWIFQKRLKTKDMSSGLPLRCTQWIWDEAAASETDPYDQNKTFCTTSKTLKQLCCGTDGLFLPRRAYARQVSANSIWERSWSGGRGGQRACGGKYWNEIKEGSCKQKTKQHRPLFSTLIAFLRQMGLWMLKQGGEGSQAKKKV